ncbi:MAG: dihydrolipoyl dehydrogenase [Bacillota bacterium]|nr:dihydrolipoyl dehydrogenase [Bacillota bacterium]
MKDLVIIGGGPGGYVAAIRARQLGMEVTLAEKERVGGTCLNRGCIPTKAYYKNAEFLRSLERLNEFGVGGISDWRFDLEAARFRKESVVGNLVSGVEDLLKANGVEVISGAASIESPGQVMVNGQRLETKQILIATGSENAVLPIPGTDLPGVVSSTEILDLTNVPKRIVIIGGGVIGMEFACIFRAFGSEVTVFEASENILGGLDGELVKRMKVFTKKQGIQVHTGVSVQKIEKSETTLQVYAEGKKGNLIEASDIVLVSAGRRPCTSELNLDKIGIKTDKGFIKVDDRFRTSVPGIFAIGDVIGGQMLAHLASEEGKAVVEQMAGMESQVAYHAVPSCIFTFPEIASVGLSQEDAKNRGIECKVGKFQMAANGKAMTMGERDGIVKVIADEEDRILGVHIIGPHASDLILEAIYMVKEGLTIAQVSGTIHPHPTLGEALMEAVMDVHKEAIHLMPPKR